MFSLMPNPFRSPAGPWRAEGGGQPAPRTYLGGQERALGGLYHSHVSLANPKKFFHRASDLFPKVTAMNRWALIPRCGHRKKVRNSEVIKT